MNPCAKEADISEVKTRILNLERWQEQQNGALIRLSEQVADISDELAVKVERIYEKFEAVEREQKKILLSVLLAIATSFINLILKLVVN